MMSVDDPMILLTLLAQAVTDPVILLTLLAQAVNDPVILFGCCKRGKYCRKYP